MTPRSRTKDLSSTTNDGEPWYAYAGSVATALALLTGAVVYGLLAAAYDTYYSELGLTPADAGISYGRSLGGAAGLTVVVLVAIGAISGVLVLGVVLVEAVIGRRAPARPARERLTALLAAGVATCVSWVVLTHELGQLANEMADDVKQGRWVQPPELFGLTLFSARAFPVAALDTTTQSAAESELAEELRRHRLMYIGSNSGQLLLYDYDTQQEVMLPSSAFRVHVLNCETGIVLKHRDLMDPEGLCRRPSYKSFCSEFIPGRDVIGHEDCAARRGS